MAASYCGSVSPDPGLFRGAFGFPMGKLARGHIKAAPCGVAVSTARMLVGIRRARQKNQYSPCLSPGAAPASTNKTPPVGAPSSMRARGE